MTLCHLNCQMVKSSSLNNNMKLNIVKHVKPSIALCTLGSMNWGAFRHPDDMKRGSKLLVRALHNLLQYQDFLSIQSEKHNADFEPLGIGVTNLAYWHAKRKLKYGEPEALAEVKRWIEHQTFYITQASVELAKEKGPCAMSSTTSYGKGVFPWEKRAVGVNELTDFTPSDDLDWAGLRTQMQTYGIRNSVLGGLPPVESCQSKSNRLLLNDSSDATLGDILTNAGVDVDAVEHSGQQQWVNVSVPFDLVGQDGSAQMVEKVWYNGVAETQRITFDDGSTYEFTNNHRLLVIRGQLEQWVYVRDLLEGDDVKTLDNNLAVRTIEPGRRQHTWDVSTPSETFLLSNRCVSHNSSVVLNSTNGIEMVKELIVFKSSKAGEFPQVVPEYHKLKKHYQMLWDQRDCIDYLKTVAVLQAYVDQGISSNTFYSPKFFPEGKIPSTLVVKNLMLAHKWGLKTHYYHLVDKQGAVDSLKEIPLQAAEVKQGVDDSYCESCVL